MDNEPAPVLDDRYRLLDELGHGGMSDVYRANDEVLQREVAVKVLREVEDPTLHARFIAEAKLLAGLNHPGLVTLLDAGIRSDRPYLVMTLAEGPTLSARLSAGALPPTAVADIGTQVAAALAYAHREGVTHRDVKPSNVLLCDDSRALLSDFGIARLTGDLEQHTRTGETIGSPAYLAPEQAAGEPITPAADVYSLGLVLLEALTGERAFPGPPVEAAVRRLIAPPVLPTSLPDPWHELLERMLAREPEARPAAGDVAVALAALGDGPGTGTAERAYPPLARVQDQDRRYDAEGTGTLAVAPTTPSDDAMEPVEPAAPTRRQGRPWLRAAAAAVALLVVGLVVLLTLHDPEPVPQRSEVPAEVPARYQAPLQELHDAIEGPR
ncbi:serine/threonine-protein kinase [Nocardioides caeni]|uniref:non-specific serine/threonine protein kinase n=1 Tax=Nocardioides caeni TaxID=574700 RepID=A0A4S8N4Z8_9ACTN|nr:serine/threonine-protein kinase [Nocardioides caeni]THV11190.1 serine/threonine protein kinase [Nocardioides caeni]